MKSMHWDTDKEKLKGMTAEQVADMIVEHCRLMMSMDGEGELRTEKGETVFRDLVAMYLEEHAANEVAKASVEIKGKGYCPIPPHWLGEGEKP